jgi:Sigma-70 region 2
MAPSGRCYAARVATGLAGRSVEDFEAHRGRLFSVADRLLGSASDAEDAVQDAFLRWSGADGESIEKPGAWLVTALTNLCLNRLTSARARREQYVGLWLPEPVLTAGGALGPLETVEQRESVSLALLVLLERLAPAARRLRPPRGVRLPLSGHRRGPPPVRGELPAAVPPRPAPSRRWRRPGRRGPRRRAGAAPESGRIVRNLSASMCQHRSCGPATTRASP